MNEQLAEKQILIAYCELSCHRDSFSKTHWIAYLCRVDPAGFIEEEGGTVERFQRECKDALRTLDDYSSRRFAMFVVK